MNAWLPQFLLTRTVDSKGLNL